MTFNSAMLKKFFLPLTVLAATTLVGQQAHAAETPVRAAKTQAKIAVAPTSSRAVPATAATVSTKGAALLGQPSIQSDRVSSVEAFSTYRFSVAQSSPSSPSTDNPGRAVPGATPSNTPSNPANVTPGTTPGSTTPDSTTPTTPNAVPVNPSAPSGTTPGTTPSNTTPGSPADPTTVPSTTAPGTTTPDTTTPGTTTPGTTTPDTTTPGTTTPDTTTPGTTTPTQEFAPGRATRSGSSYIGVGGNIGIGSGDTALGEGSFAVLSKIGLTRNFSVRPSILFTDDVTILLPITYDFSFGEGPTGDFGFTAAPFIGVGAAISTGDGGDVGLLLTGGLDVPISRDFTATAAVNASVTGQAAVGITLGIGYNFAGF